VPIPYLRALAAAGVRVLRFKGGMIHAKAMVVDDNLSIAGTTNLDQRSLFLNFEVMTLFYGADEATAIGQWMGGLSDQASGSLPPITPMRQIAEGFTAYLRRCCSRAGGLNSRRETG
jgi:cardiolipin synthase